MSKSVPKIIEIDRLNANGADYAGSISLKQLPRLLEAVESSEGSCDIEIAIQHEKGSRLMLRGTLKAEVMLECQRCLDSFPYLLEADTELQIVRAMPDEKSDVEMVELDEEGGINVFELVEDELLLQLPSVPKHADISECNEEMIGRATEYVADEEAEEASEQSDKDNPFAILKSLKS